MSAAGNEGAGVEILVVEDSRTQAEQLCHALESDGYHVRRAANGADALAAMRAQPPRLVISDVVMPVMDGYAMCREIKDDVRLRDIPVIILTSLSDSRDVILGVEAGVDYYLTKPYQDEALLAKIREACASPTTRDTDDSEEPFLVTLAGASRAVRSTRRRLSTLLLSTYESAVRHKEELLETQEELENLNKRQEELAGQLKEARSAAEQATSAKSSFLANMSHELRTPMNAVIGFTHLALKTDLTTQQRDSISKMHDAGISLLSLINDILDISKMDAGRLTLEAVSFNLDSVMEEMASALATSAQAKGLDVMVNIAADVPEVLEGDPQRLGQALTNLVGNCIAYTETGEVEVKVTLLEHAGRQVRIRFVVRDSGAGESARAAEIMFRPFSDTDSSTPRHSAGTGLGLSVTRRIVELMGGRIDVEGTASLGSTFAFNIILAAGTGSLPGRRSIPAEVAGMLVVVAAGNARLGRILAAMTTSLGLRARVVDSTDAACRAIREAGGSDPVRVVLTDLGMPPGGFGTPGPAVILMGAAGTSRTAALAAGASDFLSKPITASTLAGALVGVLTHNAGPASPSPDNVPAAPDLRGAHVLLVEDNEINQQVAIELLKGAGVEVQVASSGKDALALLAVPSQAFDMVLMDIQMPGMDGYETTRRIRALPCCASLPVLAMTAHAHDDERQQATDAGMNGHIGKPIDPETMFRVMGGFYTSRKDAIAEPHEAAATLVPDASVHIDGVDVDAGLRRVAGNRRLYGTLLRMFVDSQEKCPLDIDAALKAGDPDLGQRLAHKIRGVAGNLGVTAVQKAAEELELQLKGSEASEKVEATRLRLEEALKLAVTAIRRALQDGWSVAAPEKGAAAPVPPAASIDALVRLLESSDTEAVEAFETLRPALAAFAGEALTGTLASLLAAYRFSEALPVLMGIRAKGAISA